MRRDPSCPFCAIVAGEAPAEFVHQWHDAVAFRPLNPVTDGHVLVVPNEHVPDAVYDPAITAEVMGRAAILARRDAGPACNLITSVGADATQTVFHLHVHVVPRRYGDHLPLPWTPVVARVAIDESLECDGGTLNLYGRDGKRVSYRPVDRRRTGRWERTTYEVTDPSYLLRPYDGTRLVNQEVQGDE